MPMLDLPVRDPRSRPASPRLPWQVARARLRPLPHSPESYDGIPYYDDEFDMAQSCAHSEMVHDLSQFLRQMAPRAGLRVLSDNPIWYWIHDAGKQRVLYPDYALAAIDADPGRVTALDLRLVLELVSTATADKERKDTVRMHDANAANGVPEFALLYPEPDDPRSLRWFRLNVATGRYQELALPVDRCFQSQAVPGLALEVLPPAHWQPGRKVRVWYQGERLAAAEEAARAATAAEQAARTAEQAARTAEQAARTAEQAAEAVARLADHERRARETAERLADHERRARETAERLADQERRARADAEDQARQAQVENARLRALLRQAGLAPD